MAVGRAVLTNAPPLARDWPDGANIGVGCRASGIVGVDLDRHGGPDGVATFAELCARTASRGRDAHRGHPVRRPAPVLPVPAGLAVPSAVGIWPGVDTRGPGLRLGGYLAGPGSVVGGRRYEIARDNPVAGLPGWLAALITRPASTAPGRQPGGRPAPYRLPLITRRPPETGRGLRRG